MTCPRCQAVDSALASERQRVVELTDQLERSNVVQRRARERLAVLIGRVGAALDFVEAHMQESKEQSR